MKVLLFFLLCLLASSEGFHAKPSLPPPHSLPHSYVCPSFPLCHQEPGTAAWKSLPQKNQLNTASALPRTIDKILGFFNISSLNNSTNTPDEPEVLFIGPGDGSNGRSQVLSLPSFTKTNCTLRPFFGSSFRNSYRGYVARLSPDGLQLCGGYFNGVKLSSCYLVASDGSLVSSTPMQSVRHGAAAVEMEGRWWVTGGFGGDWRGGLSSTELQINNTWFNYLDFPFPVGGHCMVKLNSTHVFLTGGKFGAAYIYSRATAFIRQEDMSTPRFRHACTLHEDKVWVAGGSSYSASATSEFFSLSTSSWLPGPDLPGWASGGRMITIGGKVTLIGYKKIWQLETSGLDSVDEWTWVEVAEMKRYRYLFDVVKMKQKDCDGWKYHPAFE